MKSTALDCGIDEAGRGPWAGPVTAAAVILHPARAIAGLADSKTLTAVRRDVLEIEIKAGAAAWAIGWASVREIDELNIREATFLAMLRAVSALSIMPVRALIDGNATPPGLPCPGEAIIKGDGRIPAISAASILAKTARDRAMSALETDHPGYGFAAHKGYGTAVHAEALARLGPCPEHRRSFAPVRRALAARAA